MPDWSVPLLTVALPLAVLATTHLLGWAPAEEAHAMGLALLASVAAAGLAANLLKTQARGCRRRAALTSKHASGAPGQVGTPARWACRRR